MTPAEAELAARQRTNSIGDTFYSQAEIFGYLWAASKILAKKAYVVERTYTTSTVASQREYTFPTSTLAIKRAEYEGFRLEPISMTEDDALTSFNSGTLATGTPRFFSIWNFTVYLREVPAEVGTLTLFSYSEPQEVENGTDMDVPSLYHDDLVTYACMRMAEKNQNWDAADRFKSEWETNLKETIAFRRKQLRAAGFTVVQDADAMAYHTFRTV